MISIKDFSVGQTVFLMPYENGNIRPKNKIVEAQITKVGRQYVTAKEMQFQVPPFADGDQLDYLLQKSNYTPDYQLFATREQCEQHTYRLKLIKDINSLCQSYLLSKVPLVHLEQIHKILNDAYNKH